MLLLGISFINYNLSFVQKIFNFLNYPYKDLDSQLGL